MARPGRLDPSAVDAWLTAHPGWSREGDALQKTYMHPTFSRAIAFVVEIATVAEKMDHHPDVNIQFRRVTLRFSTHDAGGLTSLDLRGAEAADAVA